jgi:hypothetical protein
VKGPTLDRRRPGTLLMVGATVTALGIGAASAGPENIEYPAMYRGTFVNFGRIDRYDNNTVRVLYANPIAMTSQPGKPLPSGSVLLIESRPAKLGADGRPQLDPAGRFIADDKIAGVFVQEKRRGWAAEYPENIRNPDWEYAVFEADGARRANANTQPCMQCHKPRAADDFTFVFAHVIRDLRGKR